MTMKMKARELGLDDLRHDVEVLQPSGGEGLQPIRLIGQLHRIEGPYRRTLFGAVTEEVVALWVGPATDAKRVVVPDDTEVTVDRSAQRPPIGHWGSDVVPV